MLRSDFKIDHLSSVQLCTLLYLLVFLTSSQWPMSSRVWNATVKLAGRRWTRAWKRRMQRTLLWYVIRTKRALQRLKPSPDIFWASCTATASLICLPDWIHYEFDSTCGFDSTLGFPGEGPPKDKKTRQRKPKPPTTPARRGNRNRHRSKKGIEMDEDKQRAHLASFSNDLDHR